MKTSTGVEVTIKPISLMALKQSEIGLEHAYRDRGEPIDPPTYEVKTASGATVITPHDKESVAQTNDPEVTKLWDAHIEAKEKYEKEKASIMMDYAMNDGVEIKLPDDNAWEEKQKRRYINIPQDEKEKLQHYINTEVFVCGDDYKQVVIAVMRASLKGTVDEIALEAALESFQR